MAYNDEKHFDNIHSILDTFEGIYKDLKNGDAMKNYYGSKLRFWRSQYPLKRREKVIKRKCLRFTLNKIARWMANALDEIYKKNPTDDKLIKRIQKLHTQCYSLSTTTDFGTCFPFLEIQSPAVSSDEGEE